mgnify:CR=1 FL=1
MSRQEEALKIEKALNMTLPEALKQIEASRRTDLRADWRILADYLSELGCDARDLTLRAALEEINANKRRDLISNWLPIREFLADEDI